MSNITKTEIEVSSIELEGGEFSDEAIMFAAADTYAKGTLFARKLVSDNIVVEPDGGNTGTHVLTASARAGNTLKTGTYVLTAGTLSSGLGPWTLTDPEGETQTVTTTGGAATDNLAFTALGVDITVTDPGAGTNFATGDTADVFAVAESGVQSKAMVAAGGNTGDYTAVLSAKSGKTLKVGAYTLVAGTLTSGVGAWTLTDPSGVAEVYTTTVAAEDMSFPALGVDVTVTAVSAVFVTADQMSVTVAGVSNVVPFDPAGTGGEEEPKAVLTYAVTHTAAGSVAGRVLIKGKVNKRLLVIDTDGDGDNITAGHIDKLRAAGVFPLEVEQLAEYDN